ncbi:MAG: carbohydrate-binding protein, partial [Acidobacteria bacterium]
MTLRLGTALLPIALILTFSSQAHSQNIVLRASNVTTIQGNWTRHAGSTTAAGGQYMSSADQGWANTSAPLASPHDYFEVSFNAPAGTQYHVWFRLRAAENSKYNDSVWVQYSDALTTGGSSVYRIGSTSGLDVNLEDCSGCGVSGWGWQDGVYWMSQSTTIRFANTGSHTLRAQTREDGVQIDQVVLSPTTYLTASPGRTSNDSTIVPLSGATAAASTASGPYSGSPVSLPGRVQAENFDNGVDGSAYHDNTPGNTGAAYRQTDMDLQGCSSGGFNLAWIEAGEWANYSVNVQTAGSYTVQLRVASLSGG